MSLSRTFLQSRGYKCDVYVFNQSLSKDFFLQAMGTNVTNVTNSSSLLSKDFLENRGY